MRRVANWLLSFAILGVVTGCGTQAVNHTTSTSTGHQSAKNTSVGNTTSQSGNKTTSSASFRPLPADAQTIVIVKNSSKTTITNAVQVKSLVQAFNQAAQGKKSAIHCNAMTQDNYRITFVYADGRTRVFTNQGGACRPMVDAKSGSKFPSSNLLNKLHN